MQNGTITIDYSTPVLIGRCMSCEQTSFVCTLLNTREEVCYSCMDASEPGHGNAAYAWIGTERVTRDGWFA